MDKSIKNISPSGKTKISIDIPRKLLEEIMSDIKLTNHTRTSWFTMAAMERLKRRNEK